MYEILAQPERFINNYQNFINTVVLNINSLIFYAYVVIRSFSMIKDR